MSRFQGGHSMNRTVTAAAQAVFGSALLLGCATTSQAPQVQVKAAFDVRHAIAPADAYYELGRYFQGQRQFDRAADAYRKAVAAKERNVEAYNALGTVLAMQGNFEQARIAFEAALQIAPNAAHVHNNLGYMYLLWNRKADAIAELTRATELDGSDAQFLENLALAGGQPADVVEPTAPATPAEEPSQSAPTSLASALDGSTTAAAPSVEIIDGRSAAAVSTATATEKASPPPALRIEIVTAASTSAQPEPQAIATLSVVQPSPQIIEILANVSAQPEAIPTLPPAPARFRLEVSNGNGVTGMARYVGTLLAREGLPKARLTNSRPFVQPMTKIEYRPGFLLQALALSERLPGHPEAVAAAHGLRPATDVRVVLGHDLPRSLTFALNAPRVEVAQMTYTPPR